MSAALDNLSKFMRDNHPGYEGCLLCKGVRINTFGNTVIEYFCIEKHRGSDCDIYLINSRMWYDYESYWINGDPKWEVIFTY